MIKPLNNHCLIEVINDYEGVVGTDGSMVQKGVLRDSCIVPTHLTTSTGLVMSPELSHDISTHMERLEGMTVYWEEYSDMGKQFVVDGKNYVLIPFYRVIGYEE